MKNKTIKFKSQQGDVILRKLDKKPDGEGKLISKNRCVLAHGESGHSHVLEQEGAVLEQFGSQIVLTIPTISPVVHEEHKQHQLSPGIWDIGRVQEYDYFSKMARPVQD